MSIHTYTIPKYGESIPMYAQWLPFYAKYHVRSNFECIRYIRNTHTHVYKVLGSMDHRQTKRKKIYFKGSVFIERDCISSKVKAYAED